MVLLLHFLLKLNCQYFFGHTCHPRKGDCKAEDLQEEKLPAAQEKEENFGFKFRAKTVVCTCFQCQQYVF